jgi:hypothetical protein
MSACLPFVPDGNDFLSYCLDHLRLRFPDEEVISREAP